MSRRGRAPIRPRGAGGGRRPGQRAIQRTLVWIAGSALLLGCIPVSRVRHAPTATPPASATATSTASAPLPDAQVEALLRRAVCWYDDPALAMRCLPPGPDVLGAIEEMGRSGDARLVAPLIDMQAIALGWGPAIEAALVRLTGARPDAASGAGAAWAWYAWELAQATVPLPPGYPAWKARLLALTTTPQANTSQTRPTFADLLRDDTAGLATLVWTGTQPNGVPPLTSPRTMRGRDARYLASGDVVYGVVAGGEARAYPQRIAAWHGVVNDTVGGTPVALAVCVPCGGAAAFERRLDGTTLTFGNAALALGGRMLLFDETDHRLWDSTSGTVLARDTRALAWVPVVTTTWAAWLTANPGTSVLALETGFTRDYREGAATADDRASALPLYPVAASTSRDAPPLREPVVGVVAGGEARAYPLSRVDQQRLITDTLGGTPVVVLSLGAGLGAGAYEAKGVTLTSIEGSGAAARAVDRGGGRWFIRPRALVSTLDGRELPAVRWWQGYWFAWLAAHPASTLGGR